MLNENEATRFTAKAFAILTYYKLKDDLDDEGFIKKCAVSAVRPVVAHAKKKVLLCDKSKLGKRYFYNMGNLREVDACVCDEPLPETLTRCLP